MRVVIPARREWPLLPFLLFWFGGWTVAGITVVSSLVSGTAEDGTAFTLFWLGGWALGWLLAVSVLSGSLPGREIVEIDAGGITVRRAAGRTGASSGSRASGSATSGSSPGGSVVLDPGAQTHRFANKLDRPEASQLTEHIRREHRLPDGDPASR